MYKSLTTTTKHNNLIVTTKIITKGDKIGSLEKDSTFIVLEEGKPIPVGYK